VRVRRSAAIAAFRGRIAMKQMNVWPMVILLIVVLFVIYQLRPH
jgi:hypothetical protein